MVGIPRPAQRVDAYSFELSGGLRQRVMIALALAAEPRILIADEPTTALDVTTQAQILELIRRLQQERGLAVILITHDMGVIAEMADDVVVMYLGHEVEKGPVDAIFHAPRHPYTRALLRSIPSVLAEPRARLATIAGSIPHPYARPGGCPFHPRCHDAIAGVCEQDVPRRSRDRRSGTMWRAISTRPAWKRRHDQACRQQHRSPLREGVTASARSLMTRVLDVRDLRKFYPDPSRTARSRRRPGARGGRRELHHRSRRDAVAGGRERLRQDHHLALHPARHRADRRRDPLPHRERRRDRRGAPAAQGSCGRCGGRCR